MSALRVIWAPRQAMEEIAAGRRAGLGFGVVALSAVIGLISVAITLIGGAEQFGPQNLQGLPPGVAEQIATGIKVGLPVFTLLSAFVWWLLVAGLMHIITGFFGGQGPFPAMLAVVGVAFVPSVIQGIIQIPLTGVQAVADPQSVVAGVIGLLVTATSLAFLAWEIALVIVGASAARRVSYGQSAGSCAISCAAILGIGLLLAVVMGLVIGLAAGG